MKLPCQIADRSLSLTASGLMLLLYAPLLLHWYDGWLNKNISIEHEYFSHGLIGLPFAAYLVWSSRDRWQQEPSAAHVGGILLLLVGVIFYLSGLSDLVNLSLPIVLAGLCLWLKGVAGLRLQAFPLLLVFLATPTEMPYLITPYTLPLQRFIAGAAAFILLQCGINVQVNQIYLVVNNQIVEVAPYCAGLKMLFTSLYVGLMLLCWTDTCPPRKGCGAISRSITLWFFASIVALSISANIVRNTLLTFFHGTGREQAFDWLHEGWGGDLYSAIMLGLLVLLLRGIERSIAPATISINRS